MKKEGEKTKSNRRTTLTAWASRTERCRVAQLPRRTKHIPRRQKFMVVASFPTGSDGSVSVLCVHCMMSHTATERAADTLCHAQLSVIV